ncbi:MFS transporter [Actinospica durhamensis]|uniref:MFS transporter n=1 Tax=Actinospica durhamensis TaxID=1508375 RepID=A0A941EVD1_9ACTN|nr:MFS transporter [Actinospica durhamensis]MBR7838985.1 MFS transporter [Actinospica durhamensis]
MRPPQQHENHGDPGNHTNHGSPSTTNRHSSRENHGNSLGHDDHENTATRNQPGKDQSHVTRRTSAWRRPAALDGLTVLRHHNFGLFFVGYATSLLGSSMAGVALAFAVLDSGGSASELGLVLAAVPVTQLLFMLFGGVVADWFGPRRVMLVGDTIRCAAQAGLACSLLTGHPGVWTFISLSAARGVGEALFNPALSALVVRTVPRERLGDANALLGFAQSAAKVAGPTLAGVGIALASAGVVVAIDAGTYTCSLLALGLLRVREVPTVGRPSMLRSMGEGWSAFRSRSWLVTSTLQFTCLNFLVWGPFLVLGPVLTHQLPAGARDWGFIMGGYGVGSILGGLLALGRHPGRPLFVATVATAGYAAPCALLAAHAPVALIAAGACLAGIGSTVSAALADTTTQRHTPADVLARVRTFQTFGAFSLGPIALALAGPVSAQFGAQRVLAFGAIWTVVSVAAVLAVPSVRTVSWDGVSEHEQGPEAHLPTRAGPATTVTPPPAQRRVP